MTRDRFAVLQVELIELNAVAVKFLSIELLLAGIVSGVQGR